MDASRSRRDTADPAVDTAGSAIARGLSPSRRRGRLRAARPLAVTTAAVLAAAFAASAGRAGGTPQPAPVPVRTSRGEFQVLVHAPRGMAPAGASGRPLVLLISGEGGWREFDALLAGWLSDAGFWVGGVDIKPYFRDPQDDRTTLSSDFRAYAAALTEAAGFQPDAPLVIAGFSFGADLAPWLAGAGGWEKRLAGLVMIGPDETGSLEYRLLELLYFSPTSHTFSVASALRSAEAYPVLFLHGGSDGSSAAPELAARFRGTKKLVAVPGASHHFRGHERDLRDALLDGMDWLARASAAPSPGRRSQ